MEHSIFIAGLVMLVVMIPPMWTAPRISTASSSSSSDYLHQLPKNKDIPKLAEPSHESDEEVEELHHLGQENGKIIVNTTTANPVDKRNQLANKGDMISEFTSSKDTPRDMAEYIFWTGDENSVTGAIKDFMDQGLMSQGEGISFLEEVRYYLQQMQQRYGPVMLAGAEAGTVNSAKLQHEPVKYGLDEENERVNEGNQEPKLGAKNRLIDNNEPVSRSIFLPKLIKPQGEIVVTSYESKGQSASKQPVAEKQTKDRSIDDSKLPSVEDNAKEDVLEHFKLTDLLNNEYSLEEIIYQLARILFAQSLSQAGNPEAEEALQKFADFLEKESSEGKLTPQLQKKVLDVLLMSLFDAMGDQGHVSGLDKSPLAKKKLVLPDKH